MYGMYNKIYNYLGIFAFLADLGLYTITIREITASKKDTAKIIGNVLSLRFALWVCILFLALIIAYFLPGYNSALALAWIGIISIFTVVSLINSAILALMQSHMKMEFSFVSVVAWKILNIGLVALTAFIFFPNAQETGFWLPFLMILGAGLAGIVLNTAMNYFYAKNIAPLQFRYDREYITHIFRISLPYGLALFLGVVYFKVDVILLSLLETPHQADISIAYYGLPMKIVEVLMVLGGFYLNSILPHLSEYFSQKKMEKFSHILSTSATILFSGAIFIWFFATLFGKHIITIVANNSYVEGIGHIYSSLSVFPIVLAVLVFHFLSLVFIYGLIATKNQSILLKINGIVTLFNIVGNCILIPHYSFMWAAIVTVMSQILLMVLWYIWVRKITPVKIDFISILGIFMLGGISYYIGKTFLDYTNFSIYLDVIIGGFLMSLIFFGGAYIMLKKKVLTTFAQ